MARSLVSKQVLDQLIRAKLVEERICAGVKPLPVAWRRPVNGNCNWAIPGWTGESAAVLACTERMRAYLQDLRYQFDIPDEG